MESNIPYDWLKGKSEEEKVKVRDLVLNSVAFTNLLTSVLKEYYQTLEDKELDEREYCKPEVTHLLAHRAGQKYMINKIYDLINFKKGN